jgi:PAS domain S-box-containing protein
VKPESRAEKGESGRECEERFRSLFNNIAVGVALLDTKGYILAPNTTLCHFLGYSQEELIGMHFAKFTHSQDLDNELKMFRSLVAGRRNSYTLKKRCVRKNGTIAWGCVSVSLIRDCKGAPKHVAVVCRNITKCKTAEESLRKSKEKLKHYSEHLEDLVHERTKELAESEHRYSVLVEESSDIIAIVQDGKVVFTNKKGLDLSGYSKKEITRMPFEKLVGPKFRNYAKERYKQILRGEHVIPIFEHEVVTKKGEIIPLEMISKLITYRGRPADFVIMRDIRQRKRIEEERLKLEKLAAIGELATMVGHDLRNPLQSIENAAYYLNRELPKYNIPRQATEMFQVINNSIDYADKIIRDLQDYATTRKPTLQTVNLNSILKETISQTYVPENVQVTTEFAQLSDMKIDQDMILRVFLNLTINGIQAMEKGGTLTISTKQTGGFVEISFKDTGIGIPKEDFPQLFTPLFTTKAKGMGMGLAICKKFVDSHNGTIQVKSEEGKGTTFTVRLPIPIIENNRETEVKTVDKSQTTHTSS